MLMRVAMCDTPDAGAGMTTFDVVPVVVNGSVWGSPTAMSGVARGGHQGHQRRGGGRGADGHGGEDDPVRVGYVVGGRGVLRRVFEVQGRRVLADEADGVVVEGDPDFLAVVV